MRQMGLPGPARSAVWTPAHVSRAILSAYRRILPPAAPPSVSAERRVDGASQTQ